jgi:hypothetical protein
MVESYDRVKNFVIISKSIFARSIKTSVLYADKVFVKRSKVLH